MTLLNFEAAARQDVVLDLMVRHGLSPKQAGLPRLFESSQPVQPALCPLYFVVHVADYVRATLCRDALLTAARGL
jgi:hypothetical protein